MKYLVNILLLLGFIGCEYESIQQLKLDFRNLYVGNYSFKIFTAERPNSDTMLYSQGFYNGYIEKLNSNDSGLVVHFGDTLWGFLTCYPKVIVFSDRSIGSLEYPIYSGFYCVGRFIKMDSIILYMGCGGLGWTIEKSIYGHKIK
jgi:hypothetical protein